MSLPHKDKFGDREIIHHWLLANEDSTTSKGLALDQVPDSDGPSRIHDWLEKEASGPETKSLVSRLCEECIKAARNALRDMKTRGNLPKLEYRSLERSTSSFVLWVDGHKVAEGQLDDALGKSRMLRLSVLKLLISISNTLCDKLVPRLVTHPRTQLLKDLTLQAKADFLNTCGDSDSEYSEDSGSGDSVFDLSSDLVSIDWKEIADDMQTDVECLIDLGPLIESPFIDPMETKSVDSSTRDLKLDTGCQVYSNRIGHRFSEAQQDLVDRLAIANWNRLLRVLEEKEKALTENEAVVVPAANDEVVASEKGTTFHDSGLGTSVPTASAYAETVMSYRKGNHSQVQIPPMPQEGKKHNPFECLVCGRQVTMASDSAWKYAFPPLY
ncbi:hypothetical protein CcaCcLH18_06913 [Colletotrichum camelliae]|nr:hypothetical protein CcaCcLH18_06913 [Colletotrichum camelliae]